MAINIKVGRIAAIALFSLLLFFLTSATFTLVRCQPNSIERDIEIECKWNGAPVGANLKWTEPEEDPAIISNADDGGKPKSGTTSTNTAINTQQALMLTGASAGAALAGGGLLVKKKLEGSSSSEQEAKQTASISTTSSTAPKYLSDSARSYREGLELNQNDLKSSTQSQPSTPKQPSPTTQSNQSNTQNSPKGDGPPTTAGQQYMQKQMNSQSSQQSQPTQQSNQSSVGNQNELTASNLAASAAVVTKELLMQKQMESITKQSASSTSAQTGGAQQSTQATASSTSTSQNLGLLASSSSAARMAAEMWPQRQKEFEQLAKQRSDLAAKFSVPSYCTGFAYSYTAPTGNAWARLQGLGSAIGNGIDKVRVAVKPYTPYIVGATCIAIILVSMFFTGGATAPTAPTILAGGGVSISIGQGASLVGTGIVVTGLGLYTAHNLGIMNYPRQQSFEAEHTQIIEQSTSELREEKGSGHYGEDVAQEQLEQVDIGKDRLTQGEKHDKSVEQVEAWLKEQDEPILSRGKSEWDPVCTKDRLSKYGYPDIITKDYIIECKVGEDRELAYSKPQIKDYTQLAEIVGKRFLLWFFKHPEPGSRWWQIIHELEECGWLVEYGDG